LKPAVLFESLVAYDLRVYAESARAFTFHYREAEGRLEVDYVIEPRDGDWIGVEVKLGQTEIDKAANSLHRLARRVQRAPKALLVITGTSLASDPRTSRGEPAAPIYQHAILERDKAHAEEIGDSYAAWVKWRDA